MDTSGRGFDDIVFGGETRNFMCRYSRTVTTEAEYDVIPSLKSSDIIQNGILKYEVTTTIKTSEWTEISITPMHSLSKIKAK